MSLHTTKDAGIPYAARREAATTPPIVTTTTTMSLEDDYDISDLSSLAETPSLNSPLSSIRDDISEPAGFQLFTPPPSQDAGEDMPPARKRRKIESRTRTTQNLDLTSDTAQSDYDRTEALDTLLKALRKRRKIVVIAGAGISVSAGIPDFRSSHGLFKSLSKEHKLRNSGKELFDASVYKDDSSTSNFHDMVRKLSGMSADAKPTLFHRLLARLSTEGRLMRLYTQNVDGLENVLPPLRSQVPLNHKAPWPQTIQLHGGLEKMVCQKCRTISDFQPHLFDGPVPPLCPECVQNDALRTEHAGKRSHGIGRLRPRMVLYNEQNPDDEAIGAVTTADFRTRPDAVIVVGTSMKIPTVRRIVHEMCSIVRDRREGTSIWINREPTPTGKDLENCWDLIVKGDSDDVARLAALKEWDDATSEITEAYTDSDVERVQSSQGEIRVEVKTPQKQRLPAVDLVGPMAALTPPMSPRPEAQLGKPLESHKPKIVVDIPAPLKSTSQMRSNPASQGLKLSDVLNGKASKSSKAKVVLGQGAASRPPKKAPTKLKLSSTMFGKVTKASTSASIPAKKVTKPLSPQQNRNPHVPLAAVLRHDMYLMETSPYPETPPGMMLSTPSEQTLDSRSRSGSPGTAETISPTGTVPRDMLKLLN